MNSLVIINELINSYRAELKYRELSIELNPNFYNSPSEKERIEICDKMIQAFQQIRKELELVELIKIGYTGVKYNSDSGGVIKLGNIDALNFCKLSNRLDEICGWEEENAEN